MLFAYIFRYVTLWSQHMLVVITWWLGKLQTQIGYIHDNKFKEKKPTDLWMYHFCVVKTEIYF